MKKYFLFSDVHGEFSALLASLDKAGFEPDNENHILISLGDNFDRGQENVQMLLFLKEWKDKGRLQLIRGNHDDMLIDFLTGKDDGVFNCVQNGMDWTLQQLSGLELSKFIYDYPQVIIDKINENYPFILELFDVDNSKPQINKIEIGNYVLTHAGYSPLIDYAWDSTWVPFNWSRTDRFIYHFSESKEYDPNKKYVFGHWHAFRLRKEFIKETIKNEYGLDLKNHNTFEYQNFIGIDTCTNLSGYVNIYIIEE
jgi:serine/threonine protein phosphatase 1